METAYQGDIILRVGQTNLTIRSVGDLPREDATLPDGRTVESVPYLEGSVIIDDSVKFVIFSDRDGEDGRPGVGRLKGLRVGEVFTIGCQQKMFMERFPEAARDEMMSREHATVSVWQDDDGRLHIIVQDTSTNGTEVIWGETQTVSGGEWDILTNYESEVTEVGMSPEERRLRELFAPAKAIEPDRFGNRRDGRVVTTEQSVADAQLALRFCDKEVKDIITRYMPDGIFREQEASGIVRASADLRYEIGMWMIGKFDERHDMPERVRYNSENILKQINFQAGAYPEGLTSREAAALLGLAMLDGTFKRTRDAIKKDWLGEVVSGQHRYAAMQALGLNTSPYLSEVHIVRQDSRP